MSVQTLNRTMTTTIGTVPATITATCPANMGAASIIYVGRWVSAPLNQSSIAANTWTFNFATVDTSGASRDFPVVRY